MKVSLNVFNQTKVSFLCDIGHTMANIFYSCKSSSSSQAQLELQPLPKFFGTKTVWYQFFIQILFDSITLWHENFFDIKFLLPKFFLPKYFLTQQKIWPKHFLTQFFLPKNFWSKSFVVNQKHFDWPKKSFDLINFWQKKMLTQNRFDPDIFLAKIFFFTQYLFLNQNVFDPKFFLTTNCFLFELNF